MIALMTTIIGTPVAAIGLDIFCFLQTYIKTSLCVPATLIFTVFSFVANLKALTKMKGFSLQTSLTRNHSFDALFWP